jgi:hypothetical protein
MGNDCITQREERGSITLIYGSVVKFDLQNKYVGYAGQDGDSFASPRDPQIREYTICLLESMVTHFRYCQSCKSAYAKNVSDIISLLK